MSRFPTLFEDRMAEEKRIIHDEQQTIEIDLRQPGVAAFWAWVWPGAGHLYQRRYAKGLLFMIAILSTWFFGLFLGEGRVVYASFKQPMPRWHYICQLGVGLPALPAIVQNRRVSGSPPKEPLFGGWMAPPQPPVVLDMEDELGYWHKTLNYRFEMGTLYTMVAGLLNILAIYDAYAGPLIIAHDGKRRKDEKANGDKRTGDHRPDEKPSPGVPPGESAADTSAQK